MDLTSIPFIGETFFLSPIPEKVKSQAKQNDLDKILFLFAQWAITPFGLESLEMYYQISKNRLWEPDWETHMAEKNWVNIKDFCRALKMARSYYAKQTTD